MVNIPNPTEFLTKLIEVIAAGCGQIYEPTKMRRLADAEAYKIKKIAAAISESQGIETKAEYKSEGLVVTQVEPVSAAGSPEHSIADRARTRLAYQEAKKQVNIENIVQHAAEDVNNEGSVSSEPVEDDWISRFFNIAENISSEEMQRLWGKVLAGEVKKPGTYSLRTLDLLKDISKQDAEIFTKVAQLSLHNGNMAFIINPDNGGFLRDAMRVDITDTLLLKELGLLAVQDLTLTFNAMVDGGNDIIRYGKKCIIIVREKNSPPLTINVIAFTTIGHELLTLIDIEPDMTYVKKVASLYKRPDTFLGIADINSWEENVVHHTSLEEVPALDS